MFAKLTSRTTALGLFAIAAVLILINYIVIFFAPNDKGSLGIYALPALGTIFRLYIVAWVLLIVGVVLYTIRTRNFRKSVLLFGAGVLLALPIFFSDSAPNFLREHVDSVATDNHVYQLAENMMLVCPDTFDASTMRCYNRVILYQCDSLGLFCNIESTDVLIPQESSVQLRADGSKIQIITDQDTIAYTYPS